MNVLNDFEAMTSFPVHVPPARGGGTSIYPATDCAAQEGMLFSDLAVSERVSYLHYMSQVSEGVSNLRLLGYLVSQRVSNIHMGKNSQFRRIPNKKNSE